MKIAAKRLHRVQKESTSFFGFSQSGSKNAKDIFKILLCLDVEIVFFLISQVPGQIFLSLRKLTYLNVSYDKPSRPYNVMHHK